METFLGSECTAMKPLFCKKNEMKHLRSSCQIFRFKDLKLRSIFLFKDLGSSSQRFPLKDLRASSQNFPLQDLIWQFHFFFLRTKDLHLSVFQLKDLSSRSHSLPLKGLRFLSEILQLKDFEVSSQFFVLKDLKLRSQDLRSSFFFQSKDLISGSHILPDEGFEMVIWIFPTSKFETQMSQFSYLRIWFWNLNLSKPKNLEVSNMRTKMLRFSENLCLKTCGCVKVCGVNRKYS